MAEENPMSTLLQRLRATQIANARLQAANQQRIEILKAEESKQQAVAAMKADKQFMNSQYAPGNVGDLSNVLWPFYFTFPASELAPGTTTQTTITITREAPFILMSFTKAIFLKTSVMPPEYTYIDPDDESSGGSAPGLTFTLMDSVSKRQFTDRPIEIDHVGHPRFPLVLPTPQFILPNGNMQILWANANNADTYVPWMTAFGYRIRYQEAQEILSTVMG